MIFHIAPCSKPTLVVVNKKDWLTKFSWNRQPSFPRQPNTLPISKLATNISWKNVKGSKIESIILRSFLSRMEFFTNHRRSASIFLVLPECNSNWSSWDLASRISLDLSGFIIRWLGIDDWLAVLKLVWILYLYMWVYWLLGVIEGSLCEADDLGKTESSDKEWLVKICEIGRLLYGTGAWYCGRESRPWLWWWKSSWIPRVREPMKDSCGWGILYLLGETLLVNKIEIVLVVNVALFAKRRP